MCNARRTELSAHVRTRCEKLRALIVAYVNGRPAADERSRRVRLALEGGEKQGGATDRRYLSGWLRRRD